MGGEINIFFAFGAGFLSFISPCTLPLYPAFLSYITGMSVTELKEENAMLRKRSMLHTLFFLLGFAIIFIILGYALVYTSSALADLFHDYKDLVRQVGAISIVFFGLIIIGVFQPKFLMKDRKVQFKNRPSGYLGSVLIGMAFAAGWTPCSGPILLAVIGLIASSPNLGMLYMVAYILGFAIPFFILSFFISRMEWIRKHNAKIMKIGGVVMILVGILLFFDGMTYIINIFSGLFGGFTGF